MKPSDSTAFSQMMALMAELHGKACTEPFVELYWHLLKDFELSDIRRAFDTHMRNPDGGQFFPKPADIIRYLDGSAQTRALQAWTQVEQAIGRIGRYQSLAFDDPLIHAVIEDMGGWIKLCDLTLKELPFASSEFQKRYQGFVMRSPRRHPSYLWGLVERENAKEGYAITAPILVGDPQKAQIVIKTGGGNPLISKPFQSMEDFIKEITKVQQQPEDPDEK